MDKFVVKTYDGVVTEFDDYLKANEYWVDVVVKAAIKHLPHAVFWLDHDGQIEYLCGTEKNYEEWGDKR